MLLINLALVLAAASASYVNYVPNYFKLVLPPTKNLVDPDGRVQPQPEYHPYELQFDPTPAATTDSAESAESASQLVLTGSGSTESNATSSSISPSSTTHRGGAATAGMFAAPFAAALLLL